MSSDMQDRGMLSGVRIVSLAQQYPGPYCTLILADMGAEVIQVEQPGRGDPARGAGGMSSFFGSLNRNKRSITLNLKDEAGQRLCTELIGTADVLIEGFRPGVVSRLGLDPEALLERLPSLVYCSIAGYGQTGPYRDRPGHDLNYQGAAGLLADSDEVHRSSPAMGDVSSAMFAAVAILGALVERGKTGRGRYIDISMTDCLVSWMTPFVQAALDGGLGVPRGREPAYGIFECADGAHITLGIAHEDHFWLGLCTELGLDALGVLSGAERRERTDELKEVLSDRLRTRPRDEWVEVLARAGIPAAPVLTLRETIDDPQFGAREMFLTAAPTAGVISTHVASPIRYAGARKTVPTPAPALGVDTEAILEELGYSIEAVEAFRAREIV